MNNPSSGILGLVWRGAAVLALSLAAAASDAQEGSWRDAAPLPQARSEVSVATDGTYLYLAGGFAAEGAGQRASTPRETFRYDPALDGWEAMPPLPFGIHHAALVALDERLYLIGGFRELSWQALSEVWVLEPGAEEWRAGPPMPAARGALAAAVLAGRIHAVGGERARTTVGEHTVFDPATEVWSEAPPIATPRNHHAAISLGKKLYVFGGRDEVSSDMTSTEVYDPEGGGWHPAAPMPTGRSGIATAELGEKAVVFGGETFGSGPARTYDEAEAYDPVSDSWSTFAPLSIARHGLGAARLGGGVHVVAGGPAAGFSYSTEHSILTLP